MRTVMLAIIVGALGVLGAAPARANGRFPASNQIAFSPTDPDLIVLRATFGVLVSHDGGSTWTWLCEGALGIAASVVQDPAVALTSTNALVAGLQTGLDVSSDTGCNWSYASGALAQQAVFDVVVRRDDPHVALAGISTLDPDAGQAGAGDASSGEAGASEAGASDAGAGDGGSGEAGAGPSYANQLFQSMDDGANWAPLGVPFDRALVVSTFDVAPSDPNRLYVAGIRDVTTTRSFWMTVSSNAGAQWSEVSLPLDPTTDQEPFVAGVDPTDADRVYIRSEGSPSRLFMSEDGGQTFQVVLSLVHEITGFALSPDGKTIYAGSNQDGLFVASPPGAPFQKVSSIQVGCLATRAGELWACSTEASGFVVGVSTDNGATFAPRLHLADIRGPMACGQDATASVCAVSSSAFSSLCTILNQCFATGPLAPEYEGGPPSPMSALCRSGPGCPCQSLDNCFVADAGGTTADGGAVSAPAPRHAGCGCSVAGGGSAAGLVGGGLLAAIAVRRRRRSRGDLARHPPR
jgi:MYXO-CTERM domain-containing protein